MSIIQAGGTAVGCHSHIDNTAWWFPDVGYDFDFKNGRYFGGTAADLVCTRTGSTAYADQVNGDWVPFANNVPRITDRGMRCEGQRTNSIRNNSMQNAVASVPITPVAVTSITNVGTTATLNTVSPHSAVAGSVITVSGCNEAAYNGTFAVHTGAGSSLTYEMASDPGGPATGAPVYTAITQGTGPTNWSIGGGWTLGTSRVVVGTGTESGIDYIDIRWVGLSTGYSDINFDTSGAAATQGQTWSLSAFIKRVGGSMANISVAQMILYGAPGFADNRSASVAGAPTSGALGLSRFKAHRTYNIGTTNNASPRLAVTGTGSFIDVTFRIGWPQLENNGINNTLASVARVSGGAGYTALDVLTVAGTNGTPPTIRVDTVDGGGAITGQTVLTPGTNVTTWPTATPASVTGGTGAGATFTLTATNNESIALASSPIRTTTAALTRGTDVVYLPVLNFGAAGTMFAQVVPLRAAHPTNEVLICFNDNSANNEVLLYRNNGPGINFAVTAAGVSQGACFNSAPFTDEVSFKVAGAYQVNDFAAYLRGTVVGTPDTSATMPTGLDRAHMGIRLGASFPADSILERISIWPTTRQLNAFLAQITA